MYCSDIDTVSNTTTLRASQVTFSTSLEFLVSSKRLSVIADALKHSPYVRAQQHKIPWDHALTSHSKMILGHPHHPLWTCKNLSSVWPNQRECCKDGPSNQTLQHQQSPLQNRNMDLLRLYNSSFFRRKNTKYIISFNTSKVEPSSFSCSFNQQR